MKIFSLYFFSLTASLVPSFVFAQEDSSRIFASIEKYSLSVEIDAEHHNILGEARMQIHILKDSVSRVRFTLAPSMTMLSVRDSADKKLGTVEEPPPSDMSQKEISVTMSDSLKRGEFLLLKVYYKEEFDNSTSESSFISPKEFLLSSTNSVLWWPILSAATNPLLNQAAPVLLEVTFPSAFTVVSNGEPDSLHTVDSKTMQRFVYKNQMSLKSCFLLCGSTEFTKRSITGSDSSFEFSLYYNPGKFSGEFAGAVLRQLRDAYSYFSSVTCTDTDICRCSCCCCRC